MHGNPMSTHNQPPGPSVPKKQVWMIEPQKVYAGDLFSSVRVLGSVIKKSDSILGIFSQMSYREGSGPYRNSFIQRTFHDD